MADPLIPSTDESKLSALNKKIIEIKKKIQLSEGQRKANFEDCDAKKRESSEKITNLKKEIKALQITLAKTKNNEDAAEKVAPVSRESSACIRRRGLEATIANVDEDNIRLRKKLDLIKYQSDKQQERLSALLVEYEELVTGKTQKIAEKKLKIVSLENQLHRISVMQMEANTVRKKYRCVRSSLKSDAAFYVSSLRNLEAQIKEQDAEIKQLQGVKEEAVDLRDVTKETLNKQEVEAVETSKARDLVILDYRQKVEDRKLELERLERMIFPASRQLPRDDFEADDEKKSAAARAENAEEPKDEVTRLEEGFVKLRSATGVIKTEDVLDRFLGQRATLEKLQKMRTIAEEEKLTLEKLRQQLTVELESHKFSETKDVDENAEEMEELKNKIEQELQRQNKAEKESERIQGTLNGIIQILWTFCDLLRDMTDTKVPVDPGSVDDPQALLEILEEKMKKCLDLLGGFEKYAEIFKPEKVVVDREMENSSGGSKSEKSRVVHTDDRPLFPPFPEATTPGAPPPASEDEEEVPTRSVLKRQAQLLVDTKSRRKGFNFRR